MRILEKIANRLTTTRHALWLGAGISSPSGVPTVNVLRTRILQGLGMCNSDIQEYEQTNPPFESLMEVLMSASDCTMLFNVFQGMRPSLCHQVASQLVKRGLVQTICTTNFDTLLEDALHAHDVKFELYTSDKSFSSIDWSTQNVRVIKLHGTILDVDGLFLTIRRVAAQQHIEICKKVIQELFNNENKGGLIILGYSCSDHFDITPAARAVARSDRRVLYVSHDESTLRPATARLHESHPDNPFVDFEATSVTCATNDLLAVVERKLSKSTPLEDIPTSEWQTVVDRWLYSLDQERGKSFRNYIAGLVLKSANLWAKSNKQLNSAIERDLSEEIRPRTLLVMGNNYRDLGQKNKADKILRKAKSLANSKHQIHIEAKILNSLGIVYEDKRQHDTAIQLHLQALSLLDSIKNKQDIQDEELEGKCHGNLGIAYKNRNADGDLSRSLCHHQIAHKLAVRIGDKRSEGRTLGNIGLVYSAMHNVRKAIEYYEQAQTVAESLGDLLHVGIWLINAGEDLADDDPTKACKLLLQSKDIFSKLGQTDLVHQSETLLGQLNIHQSHLQNSHAT